MTPISHGYALSDVIVPAEGFTSAQLREAMYQLTADPDQDALLLESCDLAEADAMMNPGVDLIAEAVTAVKNRLDRTMSALVRVFRRHSSGVEPYEYPSIGPDRKNALFAYKTVTFTFNDGQTVSILFHSPGRDPMKLAADDTLIAYRWMLNRRDITATVAPERGRDLNLQTMARRIMQLVEEHSERFQANNAKRQEEQEKLAALESEQEEVNQRVEALTQENAELSGSIEQADQRIAWLRSRLADLGEGDREGSGAGGDSADTPASGGDVAKGVAARAGLDALRMGRGHRVDGIEYNRTGAGTEVIVGGQVAAVVKGRLSKNSVKAALHQTAGDTMAEAFESFGEALKAQLHLPAGHSLEFETAAEIKRRAETMGGVSSADESVRIRREASVEGGYSGRVQLSINDRNARVAIFLTNEETGVTEDRATVINGDNLSQLTSRTAEYLNGKFGVDQEPRDSIANNDPVAGGDGDSEAFQDYMARIGQAETIKEVVAVQLDIEGDDRIQGNEAEILTEAMREAKVRISQAKAASPEMEAAVERMMEALRNSTELQARIRREVPGQDKGALIPETFRPYARNWFERNADEVLGEETKQALRPEIVERFAEPASAYIAELAQEFAESGSDGEPGDLEALDARVHREMVQSIAMVRNIDNGDEPGMNRSAFTTNMANRLRTQARNGNTEVVDAALLMLADQGLAHGRPILARRNRIWSVTGQDADYYEEIANRRRQAASGGESATIGGVPIPGTRDSGDSLTGDPTNRAELVEAIGQAVAIEASDSLGDVEERVTTYLSEQIGRNVSDELSALLTEAITDSEAIARELMGESSGTDEEEPAMTEQQQIEAALQGLIDNETDASAFDSALDEWAERAEAAGLMDALDAKLNEAADKLTDLLNAEAANVA